MRLSAADRRRPTLGDGLVVLVVAAAALLLLAALRPKGTDSLTATITLDGQVVAQYQLAELSQPVSLTLEQAPYPLTIQIEADGVSILHSACPSQDCVRTGRITQTGQQIICLPNRLVVSLTGAGDLEFDAVTG